MYVHETENQSICLSEFAFFFFFKMTQIIMPILHFCNLLNTKVWDLNSKLLGVVCSHTYHVQPIGTWCFIKNGGILYEKHNLTNTVIMFETKTVLGRQHLDLTVYHQADWNSTVIIQYREKGEINFQHAINQASFICFHTESIPFCRICNYWNSE